MKRAQLVIGGPSMLVFLLHQFCCPSVHFFIQAANMVEHFLCARHWAWPQKLDVVP